MDELGLKRMAAEMIYLALLDIANKDKLQSLMKHDSTNRELRYLSAKSWIEENSTDTFGFRWCMSTCEINPVFVRKAISKLKAGYNLNQALGKFSVYNARKNNET